MNNIRTKEAIILNTSGILYRFNYLSGKQFGIKVGYTENYGYFDNDINKLTFYIY